MSAVSAEAQVFASKEQIAREALAREVRAHRVKLLSDREIKELFERAESIAKEEAKQIAEESAQSHNARVETREKCKDVVYRTRNENACRAAQGTLWMLYQREARTKDQVFETLLLGSCNIVDASRKQLVRANCLPRE